MKLSFQPAALSMAFAAVLTAMPVLAHHGFTGRYDATAPVWLEGEVTEVFVGQPHPVITLTTAAGLALPEAADATIAEAAGDAALTVRPDTVGASVTVEFPPIRAFFDLDGRVAVGDTVRIVAFRNCDEPHQLRGQWIAPAEGDPAFRTMPTQTEVQGC